METVTKPVEQQTQKNHHRRINWQKLSRAILLALWVGLVLLASQYTIAYLLLFTVGSERVTQPVWTAVYQALSYTLALIFLFLVTPRLYSQIQKQLAKKHEKNGEPEVQTLATNRAELGFKTLPTFVDLMLPIVAYVVYIALAQGATFLVEQILPWFDPDQAQEIGYSHFMGSGDRFIAMLSIVFVAPIAEELIMRGWLYGKIREWLKPISAILIVSLLFAVLHGQLNVGISTFILSILLCTMREITGTIWSGIILHMIVNGISFYILYVAM